MQTFNDRHAREILEPCGIDRYITIDERGVWPAAKYDATDGVNLFRWRAARVFQGEPTAQEVADTPMLPYQFTARQLAAFMLEGVGALVSGFYGDYENGPDPASLNAIDPDSNARTAIIQAYAARREAEKTVGACPLALEAEADRARKAYQLANRAANILEGVSESIPGTDDSSDRRARAVASIAKQDAEMEATAIAWKQGYEEWLNLMVRELLKPAPAQTAPAPVVTASDAPAKPTATIDRGWVMKRAALIEKHERQWPTINRDFQDASENGLSKSAKAPGHGDWFEADALIWARQRGKLSETTGQQTPSPATPFGGLTHRIKG